MTDPIDYTALDAGKHVNYWTHDVALQRTVERRCDPDDSLRDRLASFGEVMGHEIAPNTEVVADNDPELRTYDADGERVNEVTHHPAHIENEQLVYEHGLFADAFEAPPGRDEPLDFLPHFAEFTLLTIGGNTGLTCPGAMTGGAALVLEKFDDGTLADYYDGLTARDYDDLATGAMFLTEKQGGSDVGANEVRAEPTDEAGVYRLYGEKWFCSNIDSEAALVLARRPDAPDGTEGLSLFCLSTVDADPDNILFRRLKDKLGTRSVPTGEVEFEGAEAQLVGEPERGFKYMSEMLNMERLYNALGSVGGIGRALLESKVHTAEREAFGDRLADQPLMRRDLVDMAVAHEAAMAVTFEAAEQFARRERARRASDGAADTDSEAYRLMRILTPVAKYRCARMTVDATTYAMEIRGGDGYVEEQVHPQMVRDAHVSPIWEGPSNVMALDVLRSMLTEGSHDALLSDLRERLDAIDDPRLADTAATVAEELDGLAEAFAAIGTAGQEGAQLAAKELADYVFDVTAGVLLLERAGRRLDEADDAREALVAEWFVGEHLETVDARGIPEDDRLPVEAFDAIVRYGRAEPEAVQPVADD